MNNDHTDDDLPNLIQFWREVASRVTALNFREGVDVNDSISDVKIRQVKSRLGHSLSHSLILPR
jgi:hypothetical protein